MSFTDTPSNSMIAKEPVRESVELNDGKQIRFVEYDAQLNIFRVGWKDKTNNQYVRFSTQEWHRIAEYFRTIGVNTS